MFRATSISFAASSGNLLDAKLIKSTDGGEPIRMVLRFLFQKIQQDRQLLRTVKARNELSAHGVLSGIIREQFAKGVLDFRRNHSDAGQSGLVRSRASQK